MGAHNEALRKPSGSSQKALRKLSGSPQEALKNLPCLVPGRIPNLYSL
jgi:hypothetical protein